METEVQRHILTRTFLNLERRKAEVSSLEETIQKYAAKLQILTEEEANATITCRRLKEQSEFVLTQIQGLRERRERVVAEDIENLHFSNEVIARKWVLLSKGETTKQKRARKIEWLKNWLKRERAEKVRNKMQIGIEEILKKKLSSMLNRITSACKTENIEEIVGKHEKLLIQNEALIVDSESALHEISALKLTFVRLQEELITAQQPRERHRKGQDSIPLIDLLPRIQKMKQSERRVVEREVKAQEIHTTTKIALQFFIRVLTLFLELDWAHELLVPDLPPLSLMSFPQLTLIFIKTLTSAHDIGLQRPAFIVKKKNVVFAIQMMVQNVLNRQRSTFITQRSSEQYSSHFVKPVLENSEMVRRDSYIGSLLTSVANYEKTALEGVKSLPNLQGTKEMNVTDQERMEMEEIREGQKRYQTEKRTSGVMKGPILTSPRKEKRVFHHIDLPKIDQKQLLAREMIELDRQRHDISLQNIRHWKEGTLSFALLASRIRSSKFPASNRKLGRMDTHDLTVATARTPRSAKSGAAEISERSTKYISPKSAGKQSFSALNSPLGSRQHTQRLKRLFEDTMLKE